MLRTGGEPGCGRTAPSTTGYPHPGTLLSGLLAWLDARSRGVRFFVRLEDLDVGRSREAYVVALGQAFGWLGLEVDGVERQRRNLTRHAEVLDGLAERGLLYACGCSRARLRHLAGVSGEVGTAAYDDYCRDRGKPLDAAGWRRAPNTVRLRLVTRDPDAFPEPMAWPYGDPIVRRRDGSTGYALASVVDDVALGVTRVVRGQDLAVHEPLHRAIYATLGHVPPTFLHHPLLYAQNAQRKLAKLHGSLPIDPARPPCAPTGLVGLLAHALGLQDSPRPIAPQQLLEGFRWCRLPPPQAELRWPSGGV